MGNSIRIGLLLGTTLGATAISLPAYAQDAAQGNQGVEEIVVTARGRNEALQNVPLAVTAFSEKAIEDKKITGVSDFLSSTPNISINQSQSAGVSFLTVRGVSQVRNGESPVAVVIDGVQQVTSRQLTQELFRPAEHRSSARSSGRSLWSQRNWRRHRHQHQEAE